MPDMSWTPSQGDTISKGDSYEFIEQVGSGGFSVVWKAQNQSTGEDVAIKVPNYANANMPDTDIEVYFGRELSALENITNAGGHPHIMELHESVSHQGVDLMVVDFITGELMEDVQSITDSQKVRQIGIAICDIFSFLHENEIIYRDLKPDNIMLTGNDEPKLIDFNTARDPLQCPNGHEIKFENADQNHCTVCGTDLNSGTVVTAGGKFKAPDLTNQQYRQGPWTDVYAIGKILFYILNSGQAVIQDNIDPRDYQVSTSAPLAEIIQRSTAVNPTNRFRNATEMKEALEQNDASVSGPSATLRIQSTGQEFTVSPGDTLGRKNTAGPYATIEVDDPGNDAYISRIHMKFEHEQGRWVLKDTSKNGTILYKNGTPYQLDSTSRTQNPDRRALDDRDVISPVAENYGLDLQFRTN